MSGTISATGGLRRITRLVPDVRIRVFGFIIVVLLGSALLAWLTHSLWQQLQRLQLEHAAVRGQSFYLGVTMRGAIRSLDEKLLAFALEPDSQTRAAFQREATELKNWISTNRAHLATVAELKLLQRMELSKAVALMEQAERAYTAYLEHAASLLAENPPGSAVVFRRVYQEVKANSATLIAICNDLVGFQTKGFSEFLEQTQDTLASHQRLLKITSGLVLGLALTLGLLTYRGMIAPLRTGLDQSKSIIERQEKLASLGLLASGVAHEIRNPLTAIKMRLFSLKKAIPPVSGSEDARLIAEEINRLESIVKSFLQFARPSEPALSKLPARRLLEDVVPLMKPQLERSGIDLRIGATDDVCVHADPQQMKQVFINLVQNSAESIARNGSITLDVRADSAELAGRTRPAAILSVSDTGKGIPPEIEARLFDPFFTTKENGTGLGLAIAARIVEKHGGMLRYETRLNQGTRMEIVLPKSEYDAGKVAAN